MCEEALRGLRLILGGEEEAIEVPEVYRARYAALNPQQELPTLLKKLLEHQAVEIKSQQAFRRSKRSFPKHLLHGTLQGSGAFEKAFS